MMNNTTKELLTIGLLFSLYFVLMGCSQPISPTGGKRDTTAPTLLNSIPDNKQVNYKGKTVELTFDEYVVTESLQQKLIITPDAGEYTFKPKPMGLQISFKKTLDSAKTYSLSFGDAIKDFSEKNPAKNLRLVFSTGNYIDSASVKGQVKDALTDRPLLDVLVGLYLPSDTLNIEKIKPLYFTRSDSAGKFSIENIRGNTYQLVAFDDKNRSLTYNSRAERIDFLRDSTVLKDSTQISGVLLRLFLANNTPAKVRNTTPRTNYYSINYDKGFINYKVDFENADDSIPHFQAGINELKFYNTKNKKDTVAVKISIVDSSGTVFKHAQKIKFREARGNAKNADSNKDVFDMTTNFKDKEEIEPRLFPFKLTFNKPIGEARLNQIQLFSDSTKAEKITTQDFKWQNNYSILSIDLPISARRELKIILPKATFFSIEGDTIPEHTYKLPIMLEDDYGTLEGEIRGIKDKFIVELLDDKMEVIKSLPNQTLFQFNFLKPNTYSVRVVIDKNGNGKWDIGDFKTRTLSEPIFFYPTPIKVKKNFVMGGIDIDLSTK
ncbi:MAG: Ig-like domain-containing protein [Spirosomataceae bacterium]